MKVDEKVVQGVVLIDDHVKWKVVVELRGEEAERLAALPQDSEEVLECLQELAEQAIYNIRSGTLDDFDKGVTVDVHDYYSLYDVNLDRFWEVN